MKRALICGISGQDGAYLAQHLLSRGYAVVGTSRDAQMSSFSNLTKLGIRDQVSVESMAVTDFRSVIQTMLRTEPDEVYCLAAQSSVGLSFQQPVETLESCALGTLNLLEAIRLLKRDIRFYNACSGDCFGDTGERHADETFPFSPRSPYGVAKATSYWIVANYREAYGLYACSGLLFNHESPLRPERFVTRKVIRTASRIARGSRERLLLGATDMERDWGWAPEYVEAMSLMMQMKTPNDYVIATGESHPLRDFVACAFETFGLNWQEHVDFDPSFVRPSDIQRSRANPGRAERELGWVARFKMQDVVRMMVNAERAESTGGAT